MMPLELMALLLALVVLAACIAAPIVNRRSSVDPDPCERDLVPEARPWSRVTTDEEWS